MRLNSIQNKSKKVVGSFLLLIMVGMCITHSIFHFATSVPNSAVEALENNGLIKLSFNHLFAPNNEVVISKNSCNDKFHYTVSDLNSQNEFFNFDSKSEIIGNGIATNSKSLCAAVGSFVWSIVTGANALGALAGAFGAAAGLINEGTLGAMLGLIAEGGIGSIGAVIGLLSASEALVVALGVGGLA